MGQHVNLNIPTPCHEDWAAMTPKEHGRFCASCSKTVIDFSGMTDKQLFDFFQNYSGGACGRFFSDQLNRDIVVEQPKRMGWFRYVITLMIPAMFFANRSAAQGLVGKVKAKKTCTLPKERTVLTGDTVSWKPILQPEVEAPPTVLKIAETTKPEEILFAGFISAPKPVKKTVFHDFKKAIVESVKKTSFTVFPNPATPGGIIKTSFKTKKGSYVIQLVDVNGILVQEQKLETPNAKTDVQLSLSMNVRPGLYTVILADDKRKKIGSQKLIVQ